MALTPTCSKLPSGITHNEGLVGVLGVPSHYQPRLILTTDASYPSLFLFHRTRQHSSAGATHMVKGSLHLLSMSFVGHFPPWASASLLSVSMTMLADP